MIGTIESINNNIINIKLLLDPTKITNINGLYVAIQDTSHIFIGEIINVAKETATISLLGEFKNDHLEYGFSVSPAFNAKINLIDPKFIEKIISNNKDELTTIYIGKSQIYPDVNINADINSLFSNHLSIFGNSGSGKSCSFARIMQNLLNKPNLNDKINIVLFDAYGEYHNAFSILKANSKYKAYSLNDSENSICIPPWFLSADDYALLLNVTKASQLPIIEKTLRNVDLFVRPEEEVIKYKNSILASAVLDILLSGRKSTQIRDQFIGVLSRFYTKDLNLESIIYQPGYNRTLRQCLIIDENGKINAIEVIANFLEKFIVNDIALSLPDGSYMYTLEDFKNALEFALIDEGVWKSDKIFDEANILKVRLNSLINSEYGKIFECNNYISKTDFIKGLFQSIDGKKVRIINFNICNIDDRMSKTIVKMYSKLFFNYAKEDDINHEMPFNLFLEEAHRYVQKDSDIDIIGYNIFERIAKEGRKYGVLLGLITQRPSELSATCLSQCSNYLLFKLTHPDDIEYIRKAIPGITNDLVEKTKSEQPGKCLLFGNAFVIPLLAAVDMPNPKPSSDSIDFEKIWFQ